MFAVRLCRASPRRYDGALQFIQREAEMVQLTGEQREVFLQIAVPGDDDEVAPIQTIRELVDMGLLYEDENRRLQLSEEGEEVLDMLTEDENA